MGASEQLANEAVYQLKVTLKGYVEIAGPIKIVAEGKV